MKIFLTGFPGFIGRRVVGSLAKCHPDASFVLLIQPRLLGVARSYLEEAGLDERATLVGGDLVNRGLGIEFEHVKDVTHMWHLAAIYDLSVSEEVARRINVWGTRHVLELCERIQKTSSSFERLMYFSTSYVAGKRQGVVRESELEHDAGFHNFYESTKYDAELLVRSCLSRIPTTIIRPTIVVGDSKSGQTDKYDGPYYILQLLMQLPKSFPLMYLGRGVTRVNVVPVDFVVEASVALSTLADARGKTCHLVEKDPRTTDAFMDLATGHLGCGQPRGRLPSWLISFFLSIRSIRELLGIPPQTVAYFEHGASFDISESENLLSQVSMSCPELESYFPTLLNYMREHPVKDFLDGRQV
jgi:nucleoside-diphosphate-sugar epimerase